MDEVVNTIRLNAPYLIYFGDVKHRTYAKTGLGLIAWRPSLCLGQLRAPDCGITGDIADLSITQAVENGARSLIIGVASQGGRIPDHWVEDLVAAAAAGLDIVSGMHVRLNAITRLADAAEAGGARLVDVRTAPASLPIGTGEKRAGRRLLTVGTDCAVGKKYTALALEREMTRRGWNADFRATGQTGIMIAGRGIAIDSVVSDFLSGAAEIISPPAPADHWDVIEGQGSLAHPSYAGVSLGLLHGSQPDALVLCHEAGRETIIGTENSQPYPVPSLSEAISLNLAHARQTNPGARFVGVSVNCSGLAGTERSELLAKYSKETGLPATDPILDGTSAIVDRIEEEFGICVAV